ncbi:MAG TPA: CerR family C-terminal domain-containing protein [Usitatibacteraceae bacterium]|nr:CerR family C-terminal domain-containing protein [Usitatibacteraceae bacterium]
MAHGSGHEGETVRRILEAAAHEFARHGFVAARIRDIVDQAGVNLAAVNYHFGGKEGLYRETLAMLARRSRDEVPRESPEVRALPPEDQLRIFTRVILHRFLGGTQASPMARVFAHELLDPTPAFDDMLVGVAGPQFERLATIVGHLLGPRAGAQDVALAAFAITGQWSFYLFGRAAFERLDPALARDPALIDRLTDQICDFSLAGLAARRAALERRPKEGGGTPKRTVGRGSARAGSAESKTVQTGVVAGKRPGET